MNSTDRPAEEVGVIVGRFQTPRLHKAHRELIEAVLARHKKVIILLGTSPIKLSRRDPLDFMAREIMVKKAYPRVVVVPVEDMPSDVRWSAEVDDSVRRVVGAATARLYGSRDSFIPFYSGKYPTTELPASREISATQIREEVSREVRSEEAWRVGIMYANTQRFLISYQCVDAVIWRFRRAGAWRDRDTAENAVGVDVLLGRKKTDAPGLYRFPGGFVDPEDESLEHAAKREATEETGGNLTFYSCVYIFSTRVSDWRYRKERDKIMTAVFALEHLSGEPTPSDDLNDGVRWFDLDEIQPENLVEEHRPLWAKVRDHLKLPGKN